MSAIIKVENLSKEYRLGVIGHGTLYRDLQTWWAKVRGKEDPNSKLMEKKRLKSTSNYSYIISAMQKFDILTNKQI